MRNRLKEHDGSSSLSKKERKGAQGGRKLATEAHTTRSRIRHKKCDERRPACSQCTGTGRKCDLLLSSADTLLSRPTRQPGPKPWSLASEPGGSHATMMPMMDVWHFEYFRVVYARSFSLFLGTSLWETLVLQAALREQCILDGVLALGALSRNTVPGGLHGRPALSLEFPVGYSTRKYNLAIRQLNKRIAASPDGWELAVLGSFIFVVVESLQGNYGGAQVHLRGAMAILRSHDGPPGNSPSESRADLAQVLNALSRLHGQTLNAGKDYVSLPLRIPALPPAFGTISEARDSLNAITGALNTPLWSDKDIAGDCSMQQSTPSRLSQDFATLSGLLDSWHTLFTRFVAAHTMDTKTESCVKILLIHRQVARVSAWAHLDATESAYDAHTSAFSRIVDLAAKIIDAETVDCTATVGASPYYTFDITVVQPLFFVACKCRDGVLRRRAIGVMESIGGQGFYDTALLVRVARRVVAMEEGENSPAESPRSVKEEDRLQDIDLDFSEADTCMIRAWKRSHDGDWQEVISRLQISAP